METSLVTCVVCPRGCSVKVSWVLCDDGSKKVVEVVGNSCPRGYGYASSEVVHPKRVLTTTVRLSRKTSAGTATELLPIRSSQPLPKELMMAAMDEVSARIVEVSGSPGVKMGDVMVCNVAGSGIDMVACRNSCI